MRLSLPLAVAVSVALAACGGTVGGPTGYGVDGGAGPGFVDAGGYGGGADATCGQVNAHVSPAVPAVMLLVDRSQSMTNDFGGTSRWAAVYKTLMDPTTGVVPKLQSKIRFGLALYTSQDGYTGGTCPMLTEVAPSLNNAQAIDGVYSHAQPLGDTPTASSVQAMIQTFATVNFDGPQMIVLATDGEPDTCSVPGQPGLPAADQAAVQAVQQAYGANIRTYVVSVGSDLSQAHLQEMANAGVGLSPTGSQNAPTYRALDSSQLVKQLSSILKTAVSCQFQVNGQLDVSHASSGTVTLDGNKLAYGSEWDAVDSQTIELRGDACTTVQDGGNHDVEASFPCGVIIIK